MISYTRLRRENIMSHMQFRTALNRLAEAEDQGENIDGDIGHLAAVSRVTRSDIRAQITEIQQDA